MTAPTDRSDLSPARPRRTDGCSRGRRATTAPWASVTRASVTRAAIARAAIARAAAAMVLATMTAGCVTDEGSQGALATSNAPFTEEGSVFGSYLAARHAARSSDTSTAAEGFGRVLERDPENTDLQRRAFLAHVEAGEIDEAATLAERLEDRGGPLIDLVLGLVAARAGDFDEASRRFERMPDATVLNRVLKPMLVGWAAAGRGRPDDAKARITSVAERQGFEALGDLHRALLAGYLGDAETADGIFEKMVDRDGTPPLRLVAAIALQRARAGGQGEGEGVGQEVFDRFYPGRAKDPGVIASIAKAARGEPVPGLVSDAVDGMAEAFFDIASALQRDSGHGTALIYARMSTYGRPDFALGHVLVGEILDDRGRRAEAIETYARVPESSIYHTMAALRQASSLNALERVLEAESLLRDLMAARPGDPSPAIRLGDVLRGDERWLDAVAAYDEAETRLGKPSPGDWSLFYSRGIALERASLWERAEADFLRALELQPEQPYVLNYLGYSWIEKGLNPEKARKLIERAVELRPNDGYIVDSLGWALYRSGAYEEAVIHLERAVQLQPDDPTINDHLGDAYWRVGRRFEAEFQWRRVLSLEPEQDLISAIERKLRSGMPNPDGPPNGPPGGASSGA